MKRRTYLLFVNGRWVGTIESGWPPLRVLAHLTKRNLDSESCEVRVDGDYFDKNEIPLHDWDRYSD